MTGQERRLDILAQILGGSDDFEIQRLCDVCASVVEVTGVGIMLMSDDSPLGSLGATDPVSALIEQLQFDLGEGPCIDAYHHGRPVLEPDLVDPKELRWPAFAGPVVEAGARAVFGFPLRVGAVRVGALDMSRARPGPHTDRQHADALLLADIGARAVLLLQADAPPGAIASELESHADFRFVVHQASGMVAAQLDVSVGQALVRLRAYAFGNDLRLHDVARSVVERRLRFGEADGA